MIVWVCMDQMNSGSKAYKGGRRNRLEYIINVNTFHRTKCFTLSHYWLYGSIWLITALKRHTL